MTNRGIDYGLGTTNLDQKTGIRFGVIHSNEVLQAWADCSEAIYPEPEEELDADEEQDWYDCAEPIGHGYTSDGYVAYEGSDGDIFVEKSPYFTRAQFCSPCAPGACYLMNPCEDGERAYCFGHDWFESEEAPYPVYSVETGEIV